MQHLKQLIEKSGWDTAEFTSLIFPNVKHLDRALTNVVKGRQELTTSQLTKTAVMLDVSVNDLIAGGDEVKPKKGDLEMRTENCVFIFRKNNSTKILMLHKNSLLFSTYELGENLSFINAGLMFEDLDSYAVSLENKKE